MTKTLEDIQDELLSQLHQGLTLDQAAVLRRYPEHEGALREFFAVLEAVEGPSVPFTRLGDFRVIRELGRGGMGVVYEAEQSSLQRRVALKVLPESMRSDRHLVARFRREARAAAKLRHPNIVPVYSVGDESGPLFYAMELVPGRSLASVIAARAEGDDQTLPPSGPRYRRWAIRVTLKIASALDYAHRLGILHRDVKPDNILIDTNGQPRLTDFGLAFDNEASAITLAGQVFGSPLYMSPEQAAHNEYRVDHRSDIYSLAVTLYQTLTLRTPYRAASRAELFAALTSGRILPPRQFDPDLPASIERVLLKALSTAPDDRPATARDFAHELRLALHSDERLEQPAAPPKNRWRRLSTLAAAGVVVAGVLALGVVLGRGTRQTKPAEPEVTGNSTEPSARRESAPSNRTNPRGPDGEGAEQSPTHRPPVEAAPVRTEDSADRPLVDSTGEPRTAPPESSSRKPLEQMVTSTAVPHESALRAAAEVIEQAYDPATDWRVFVADARGAGDPAMRFALLNQARTAVAADRNVRGAVEVATEIERHFSVEPLSVASQTLDDLEQTWRGRPAADRQPGTWHDLVQARSTLSEWWLIREDAEGAAAQIRRAIQLTDLVGEQERRRLLERRLSEIRALEPILLEIREMRASEEPLAESPEGGLILGRFHALWLGNWPTGLRHLERSSHSELAQLAGDDLRSEASVGQQIALAARYWEIAKDPSFDESEQGQLRLRAAHWYEAVLSDLPIVRQRLARRRIEAAQSWLRVRTFGSNRIFWDSFDGATTIGPGNGQSFWRSHSEYGRTEIEAGSGQLLLRILENTTSVFNTTASVMSAVLDDFDFFDRELAFEVRGITFEKDQLTDRGGLLSVTLSPNRAPYSYWIPTSVELTLRPNGEVQLGYKIDAKEVSPQRAQSCIANQQVSGFDGFRFEISSSGYRLEVMQGDQVLWSDASAWDLGNRPELTAAAWGSGGDVSISLSASINKKDIGTVGRFGVAIDEFRVEAPVADASFPELAPREPVTPHRDETRASDEEARDRSPAQSGGALDQNRPQSRSSMVRLAPELPGGAGGSGAHLGWSVATNGHWVAAAALYANEVGDVLLWTAPSVHADYRRLGLDTDQLANGRFTRRASGHFGWFVEARNSRLLVGNTQYRSPGPGVAYLYEDPTRPPRAIPHPTVTTKSSFGKGGAIGEGFLAIADGSEGKLYLVEGRSGREHNVTASAAFPPKSDVDISIGGEHIFLAWRKGEDDGVLVYLRDKPGSLRELAEISAPDSLDSDAMFALAVAAGDDWFAVGAPFANVVTDAGPQIDTGCVYLYETANLEKPPITLSHGFRPGEQFGYDLAADDDRLLVGARGTKAGRAYLWTLGGNNQPTYEILRAENAGSQFGTSVALCGPIAVVGAPREGSGAVYVFRLDP